MISSLRLAGNYVSYTYSYGHLQLVGLDNDDLWEIKVQASSENWNVVGVQEQRDHTLSPYYGVAGSYASVDLTLDGRTAENIWEIFRQAAVDFGSAVTCH